MPPKKYEEINFVPPQSVADQAELGLELREEFGRGGTEVGVARARDLKNRKSLSPETIVRIYSYFSRHAVDIESEGSDSTGFPRNNENPSAGWIAWLLWGGDPGRGWADSVYAEMKEADAEEVEKMEATIDKEDFEELVEQALEDSGLTFDESDYLFVPTLEFFQALKALKDKTPELSELFEELRSSLEVFELSSLEELEDVGFFDSLELMSSIEFPSSESEFEPFERMSSLSRKILELSSNPQEKQGTEKTYTPQRVFFGKEVQKIFSDSEEIRGEFALGVVLEPTDGTDGTEIDPDSDDDVYNAEEVRKACHWYMEHGRQKGLLHGKEGGEIIGESDNRIVIVECYVSPIMIPVGTYGEQQKFDIKKGSWLLAYKINDPVVQQRLRDGEFNGLSIGGDSDYEEIS